MKDFGQFLAWSEAGVAGIQAFAHRAGCFITVADFAGWPDIKRVTIIAPLFSLEIEGDARSAEHLCYLPKIEGACYYECG